MATEEAATKDCDYCKEEVRADAVLCKHCGSRLGSSAPDHGGTCPYCKESINPEATRCRYCGSDVSGRDAATGGGGCGCGCGNAGDFPMYARQAYFGPRQTLRARDDASNLGGGQCYSRCRLYCNGDPGYCDLLCSYICEGAPVTMGSRDPLMLR